MHEAMPDTCIVCAAPRTTDPHPIESKQDLDDNGYGVNIQYPDGCSFSYFVCGACTDPADIFASRPQAEMTPELRAFIARHDEKGQCSLARPD